MAWEKAAKSIPPFPVGTYPARLISIIEVGKQVTKFNGKVTGDAFQVILTFEVPSLRLDTEEGSKPRVISTFPKNFTLRKGKGSGIGDIFRAIDNKFDEDTTTPNSLLGKTCSIVIAAGSKPEYTNLSSVAGAIHGLAVGEAENPLTYFDFDNPTEETFSAVPRFIVKKDFIEALDFPGSKTEAFVKKYYPELLGGEEAAKFSAKSIKK